MFFGLASRKYDFVSVAYLTEKPAGRRQDSSVIIDYFFEMAFIHQALFVLLLWHVEKRSVVQCRLL
jgi:hypothetical protein